jgi:acyl-CoA thioester hydrolase
MPHLFTHTIDVRFRDCDPLGHTNNAVYLTYLEQTRLHYWRELWGFGSESSRVPGVIMARAEIDYKRPSFHGQRLEVRMSLSAIGKSSFTYDYDIVDEAGHLVVKARTVQVMYDYQTARPVPISDEIRRQMDQSLKDSELL